MSVPSPLIADVRLVENDQDRGCPKRGAPCLRGGQRGTRGLRGGLCGGRLVRRSRSSAQLRGLGGVSGRRAAREVGGRLVQSPRRRSQDIHTFGVLKLTKCPLDPLCRSGADASRVSKVVSDGALVAERVSGDPADVGGGRGIAVEHARKMPRPTKSGKATRHVALDFGSTALGRHVDPVCQLLLRFT